MTYRVQVALVTRPSRIRNVLSASALGLDFDGGEFVLDVGAAIVENVAADDIRWGRTRNGVLDVFGGGIRAERRRARIGLDGRDSWIGDGSDEGLQQEAGNEGGDSKLHGAMLVDGTVDLASNTIMMQIRRGCRDHWLGLLWIAWSYSMTDPRSVIVPEDL